MERHSSKRKQFGLRYGHGTLGTLSSRSGLAETCDFWEKCLEISFSNIVICIRWSVFSLVNFLICEISVSKAREHPWSSMGWGMSGLSSTICPIPLQLHLFMHLRAFVKSSQMQIH